MLSVGSSSTMVPTPGVAKIVPLTGLDRLRLKASLPSTSTSGRMVTATVCGPVVPAGKVAHSPDGTAV